jgi:hypothetical protein
MKFVSRIWPSLVERTILYLIVLMVVLLVGLNLSGLIDNQVARVVATAIWLIAAIVLPLILDDAATDVPRPERNVIQISRSKRTSNQRDTTDVESRPTSQMAKAQESINRER